MLATEGLVQAGEGFILSLHLGVPGGPELKHAADAVFERNAAVFIAER